MPDHLFDKCPQGYYLCVTFLVGHAVLALDRFLPRRDRSGSLEALTADFPPECRTISATGVSWNAVKSAAFPAGGLKCRRLSRQGG
jgi:hypothetical protein